MLRGGALAAAGGIRAGFPLKSPRALAQGARPRLDARSDEGLWMVPFPGDCEPSDPPAAMALHLSSPSTGCLVDGLGERPERRTSTPLGFGRPESATAGATCSVSPTLWSIR